MIQISRNEIIGNENRKLTITLSSGGSPIVPAELHFAIFEINSPEKAITPVKIFPTSQDMWPVNIFDLPSAGGEKITDGNYFATFQMPPDVSLGRVKIVWYYKTNSSQPTFTTFEEEFDAIDYIDVYGSAGKPAVSITEIRTFMRDFPEYHVLVDGQLFKDSEIMTAVGQVVNSFNRINPPLGEYTAENFPDMYLLTLGVTAWLFDSEANRQLMEQLTYQDGNIHHGITDKTQLYRQAAATMKNDFNQMAREIKMQLNINGIYDGSGLGVRYRYNRYVSGTIIK